MSKNIRLYKEFGKNIVTRSEMVSFFSRVKKLHSPKLVIDFKNVEFISRSCADEYLKQKQNINSEIIEVNPSKEVESMFTLVSQQPSKESRFLGRVSVITL